MEKEEIEPIFETISPKETMSKSFPNPIVGKFDSLKEELLQKCNPKAFMIPYNHDKVEYASHLYEQILSCKKYEKEKLKAIRKEAIEKLGIRISTESLFHELCQCCSPTRFSSTESFNAQKIRIANDLYQEVRLHADDIEALEALRQKAKNNGLLFISPTKTPYPADNINVVIDGILLFIVLFTIGVIVMLILIN